MPADGAIFRSRSRAGGRLGSAPLRALFEVTAKPTVPAGHDEVFWRDLRKVVADGTVFDVSAGTDNASAFGTPAGGALPQARLVALAERGSMALVGAAFDSIEVGERALFERLLGNLTPGMLLPADRGFPSCDLYTASAATGAHLLWHVSGSSTLPVKKRLEDGTCLSELRGRRTRERVTVRVIEYSAADDDVSEVFALITTLLDLDRAPAIEPARICADRWHVEILFRLVEVDLRTPGGVLRSRTAEGARQELRALLFLYQVLRSLLTRAAAITGAGPHPHQLSARPGRRQ
ncbi:transposase [Streptomyces sp. NPDC093991]|uniref:transposase n=1 Tax=unclassified Streptomyces TaxID=2593676 RepID=UPI003449938A